MNPTERLMSRMAFVLAWIGAWYFGIVLSSRNVWPQMVVGSALWLTFPWWAPRLLRRPQRRPQRGAVELWQAVLLVFVFVIVAVAVMGLLGSKPTS
ncbi:MAG TPA: hypothetical protein VNI34_10950 [Candidatus Nitrosotalea sp.]|nr:hypothetical protein [Candidatus Nitrosotalea sp.]